MGTRSSQLRRLAASSSSLWSPVTSALGQAAGQVALAPSPPEPPDGPVDGVPLTIQLADDPAAVLADIGASDVGDDVELLDQAGDDRLPHQLLGKRQLHPDPDH